jgi:membrane-bound lytic murein transglycosylase D
MPNLPVRLDPRVIKYLKFYRDSARGRAVARAWAQKSGRFAGALKAELAKAGLPTDLVWLSLVESGHNPTIRSHAGAVGIWQFLAESGRLYGLTVDRWVDERLDPQRSTEAAIGYLSDLYRRFGTWELAMAAYNMGHAGLLRAMRKFNTNDFWELSRYEAGVPWETNLYVPKILATAIVMNNKRAFGIDDVIPETPVGFDTVLVDPGTLLEDVARAAEVTPEQIKALNRHYLAGRTPPSAANEPGRSWPVRVPSKSGVVATQRLSKQAKQPESLEPYIVRVGDTLSSIAQGAGGNEARVRSINRISPEEPLQPGTVLLVPQAAEGATSSSSEEVVVVPPRQFSYPDRMRVFYRIVAGDTLGRIAQAFGVAASELLAWNALDDSARLHVGLVLQIFVKKGQKLAHVRHTRESRARVLVAGSVDFYDYYEGLRGKKRIVVVARAGETLQSVGKRFNMSPGWIERINRRSRRDKLGAGENVVVYVDRATPKRFAAGAAEAESLPQIAPPAPNALPVAAPAPKLGAAEAKTPVTE